MLGNGHCDPQCQTAPCFFDRGDCECHDGCVVEDFASCPSLCLNYACGYASYGRAGGCQDSLAFTIATATQAMQKDFFAVMDWTACSAEEPACVFHYLSTSWSQQSCLSFPANYGYQFYCFSPPCLSLLGLCNSAIDRTCKRGFGPTKDECFECKYPNVRLHSSCLDMCPRRYQMDSTVSRLCVPRKDDSTRDTPDVLYVVESQVEGQGTLEKPYGSLGLALAASWKRFTTIFLQGDRIPLSINLSSSNPELRSLTSLFDPLEASEFQQLAIKSLTCGEMWTDYCSELYTEIDIVMPIYLTIRSPVTFERVVFTSKVLFAGLPVQFCPQIESIDGQWVDASGDVASPGIIQAASVCSGFSDYSVFIVLSGGDLNFTVTLTQEVTVRNLTLQPKAFIDIQGGSVSLENANFTNFHTLRKKGNYGVIVQSAWCEEGVCGTFSFRRGAVTYLNNGVEHLEGTIVSAFLNAQYLQAIEVRGVRFAFNFIVEAYANPSLQSRSSLIFLGDFYQLTIDDCEFRYNVVTEGLIVVKSSVSLPKSTEPGGSVAFWYGRSHLVITNSTFVKNLNGYSIIAIEFLGDVLNIVMAALDFTGNALTGSFVIDLYYAGTATEELAVGSYEFVLNPTSGSKELLWVSERHCTLANLTIAHTYAYYRLINIDYLVNVRLSNVSIVDNGYNGDDVLTKLFLEFLSDPGVAARSPASIEMSTLCGAFISCTECFNVTVSTLQVINGHCDTGSCGLIVLDNIGMTSVMDYLSEGNSCASKEALALEANYIRVQIRSLVVQNSQNAKGPLLAFGTKAAVLIADSIFQHNAGTVVSLTASAFFLARKVVWRDNQADLGAAAHWALSSAVKATAIIENCVFEGNTATSGGALAFEAVSVSAITLSISDCQFSQNRADLYGSALYVGLLVSFSGQSTVSRTPFRGHSNEYGVVYAKHHSGSVRFSDCVFEENLGTVAAAFYLESDPTAATLLDRVRFLRNRGAPAVLKSNSRVNSTFQTRSCTFLDNDSGNIMMDGGAWLDVNSTLAYSALTHVTLSASAVARVSSSNFTHAKHNNGGGAVHLMTGSVFSCTDCVFANNTAAYQGGAVFAEQDSSVTLVGCTFRNNTALLGGAALFLTSSQNEISVIHSSLIEGNDGGSFGFILLQSAVLVLSNVTARYNTGTQLPGIGLLMSTLSIRNSLFAHMRGYTATFLASFTSSSASVDDSVFADSICENAGLLQISSTSNLTITRSTFLRLTGYGVIAAASESAVSLEEVSMSFISSSAAGSLFSVTESTLTIRKGVFRDFSQSAILASSMNKVEIAEADFARGTGLEGAAGEFFQCTEIVISHSTFAGLAATGRGGALLFEAFEVGYHRAVIISNCTFANNSAAQGGAVSVNNQQVQFLSSSFTNNTAEVGGAVDLACTLPSMCTWEVSQSLFEGNAAAVKGGAVSWEVSKPRFTSPTFRSNTAQYGDDIASYAISLHIEELRPTAKVDLYNLTGVAPGQKATITIVASLRDHYGETVSIDNSSVATIESAEASISGNTKVTAQRGQFTFDDFLVYARPNSSVSVSISSPAIGADHEGDPDPHSQSTVLALALRDCVPGEELAEESCIQCAPGTYSFQPSTPCKTCPSNAKCLGGIKILPNSGYWRSSEMSPDVRLCPNPAACLGQDDTGPNLSFTGRCASAYKGNLCQSCADKYSRTGKNKCDKCPKQDVNIVRLALIAVAMVVAITVMVWSTMRSATRPAATHSIMIRIFVNYLQLVLLVTEFKLSWPEQVLELFDTQESAGGATEQAYSIDCFLGKQGSEVYYRKMICMAVLPIPLIAGALVFWLAVAARKRSLKVLKRECAATIVILFFLILPNLVKSLFSMFSCTEIEKGEYWLTVDMDIRCWNATHTFNVLVVALPAILVWIGATPLACLAVLVKYRSRHDEVWIKMQFGFLINGYRRRCYYWEFVILYRKIMIICCAVFLNNTIPVQALTVQFLLLLALFLQYNTLPYVTGQLNSLELWAIAIADVTIYSGLYYMTDDLTEGGSWFLFLLITILNLLFVLYWLSALLGYFINIASFKFHRVGQILKPGIFVDKYIEEFVGNCPKRPEAAALAQLQLRDCYKKMAEMDMDGQVPGRSRYIPRNIHVLPTNAE